MKKIKASLRIDERNPKDILKEEMYLNAPMIRRILNCTYNQALNIISTGLVREKEQNLFIVKKAREKKIRTTTFKEIVGI